MAGTALVFLWLVFIYANVSYLFYLAYWCSGPFDFVDRIFSQLALGRMNRHQWAAVSLTTLSLFSSVYLYFLLRQEQQKEKDRVFSKEAFFVLVKRIFFDLLVFFSVLLLAIFGFFVSSYFILSLFYKIEFDLNNKADFLTLLEIILGFIGIMGVGVYHFLFRNFSEKIDDGRRFTEAQAFKVDGLAQYYTFKQGEMLGKREETLEMLDSAIKITEKAARIAGRLADDPRNEVLICSCKNNLAYYLAERGFRSDKARAVALSEFCFKRKEKYPDKAGSWEDTWEFVNEKQDKKPWTR